MRATKQPSYFQVVSPVIAVISRDLLIDNCICSTNNDVVLSSGERIANPSTGLNVPLRKYSLSVLHEWCARLIMVGPDWIWLDLSSLSAPEKDSGGKKVSGSHAAPVCASIAEKQYRQSGTGGKANAKQLPHIPPASLFD